MEHGAAVLRVIYVGVCYLRANRCWHQVDGQEGEGCGDNNHVRHVKGASPFDDQLTSSRRICDTSDNLLMEQVKKNIL